MNLTDEQMRLIYAVRDGYNVLVDACIGSGKTTAIQALCRTIPESKRILYLTYNKLLKEDARGRITCGNAVVTNYHGYAWLELKKAGISAGVSDLVSVFNAACRSGRITPMRFDFLVLDEYQDLEQELADMLTYVKKANPDLQIAAVGDMEQKIYDKTTLNAQAFIREFLGPGHMVLEFTKCFRISPGLAAYLGNIWHKEICGCNPDCEVREVSFSEAFKILGRRLPHEVLCLGSNAGMRSRMQNALEDWLPDVYNKHTLWSRISDTEGGTNPSPSCAVFTTYDGCKGMERDTAVVFDWTAAYWNARINKPNARYEIIRNVFLVAASRGKRRILFVRDDNHDMLTDTDMLETEAACMRFSDMGISEMFDFKYKEDVEHAFEALKIKKIREAGEEIPARLSDGLIDLSPCAGICQEVLYFEKTKVDRYIHAFFQLHPGKDYLKQKGFEEWPVESKVLYLASLETGQQRYLYQVKGPIFTPEAETALKGRLGTFLRPDLRTQVPCTLGVETAKGREAFEMRGFADAVANKRLKPGGPLLPVTVELKFVSELSHTHFLQCAVYAAAMGHPAGILWNVRTDEMHVIEIPNRRAFLTRVVKAVTKGRIKRYTGEVPEVLGPFKGAERGRKRT